MTMSPTAMVFTNWFTCAAKFPSRAGLESGKAALILSRIASRFLAPLRSAVILKPIVRTDFLSARDSSSLLLPNRHHAHWTFSPEEGLDLYSELRGRNRWTKWHYAEILEALHSDAERVFEEIDLEDRVGSVRVRLRVPRGSGFGSGGPRRGLGRRLYASEGLQEAAPTMTTMEVLLYRLKFMNYATNREGEMTFQTEIEALTFVRSQGLKFDPISLTHPNGIVVEGKQIAELVQRMR